MRNKVIAHNEKNLKHEWDDLDSEIRKIVRIWAIVISWSSFGIIYPFHKSDQALQGLEHFFDDQEMAALHQKRQEYIDLCIRWSRSFLHNDEHDAGGYFLTNLSINIKPL